MESISLGKQIYEFSDMNMRDLEIDKMSQMILTYGDLKDPTELQGVSMIPLFMLFHSGPPRWSDDGYKFNIYHEIVSRGEKILLWI